MRKRLTALGAAGAIGLMAAAGLDPKVGGKVVYTAGDQPTVVWSSPNSDAATPNWLRFLPLLTTVFKVSGDTTFADPGNWTDSNNIIEAIGSGGNGATGNTTSGGAGGGGGAYAARVNVALSANSDFPVTLAVGSGGGTSTTSFNSSKTGREVIADYGRSGSGTTNGAGGATANSTGDSGRLFAGGAGGTSVSGRRSGTGGGGAGGPLGAGAAGGNATSSGSGGTGGGGANNGLAGGTSASAATTGTAGGASGMASSTGGATGAPPTAGTVGGGSGGGTGIGASTGAASGVQATGDQTWDASHGCGGGGGGAGGCALTTGNGNAGNGGAGGLYGGGGGGGGKSIGTGTIGTGGSGGTGLIAITYGTFVRLQRAIGGTFSGGTSTVAATFPAAVRSGNFVVVQITFDVSGSATATVADDKSNAYTAGIAVSDATQTQRHALFYLGNITNGPKTITASFVNVPGSNAIQIAEFSGVKAVSDPKDGTVSQSQTQAAPGTGTDALTTGSGVSTGAAHDLVIGAVLNDAATTADASITPGTNFSYASQFLNTSNVLMVLEYLDSGSSSGVTANGTFTASGGAGRYVTLMQAFLAQPGGATTWQGTATLAGTGTATATAVQTELGSAALIGTGAVTVPVVQRQLGSTTLAGIGVETTNANLPCQFGSASLVGAGVAATTAVQWQHDAPTLTGTGAETTNANPPAQIDTAELLAGTGAISCNATAVSGAQTYNASATLVGIGTLAIPAVLLDQASASFAGSGGLAGGFVEVEVGVENLIGAGSLSVTATQQQTATGFFSPNKLRNSALTGAVVGGSFPTNWAFTAFPGNINWAVAGTGSADPDWGVPYLDVHVTGTATATSSTITAIESGGIISCTVNDRFAFNIGIKVVTITQSGPESFVWLRLEQASDGSGITTLGAGSFIVLPGINSYNVIGTANRSTCAFIKPEIALSFTSGITYDYVVRFLYPTVATDPAAGGVLLVDARIAGQPQTASATLAGVGALTAAAVQINSDAGETYAGLGSLAAPAIQRQVGTASLAGTGTVTPSVVQWLQHSALLVNGSTLTAIPSGGTFASATLLGIGTSPAAAGIQLQQGSAALVGAGVSSAIAARTVFGNANLAGAGAIAAPVSLRAIVNATFIGVGATTEADRLFRPSSANLSASSQLAETDTVVNVAGAVLAANTVLVATPVPAGELGEGFVAASAQVSTTGSTFWPAQGTLTVAATQKMLGFGLYTGINTIPNQTMAGAVVGTPGTLPTGWSYRGGVTGFTVSVVNFGTADPIYGLPFIDISWNGTAGNVGGYLINASPPASIPAIFNDNFYMSVYVQLIAGTWPDGWIFNWVEYTSTGTGISLQGPSFFPTLPPIIGPISTIQKMRAANCGLIMPVFGFAFTTSGKAYSFTARIINFSYIRDNMALGNVAANAVVAGIFGSSQDDGTGTIQVDMLRTTYLTNELFPAVGTLQTAPAQLQLASAALAGSSQLTATPRRLSIDIAESLVGIGVMAAPASLSLMASAVLGSSGTMATNAIRQAIETAELYAGTGSLAAITAPNLGAVSAALNASGILTANAGGLRYDTGSLSASSTIQVNAFVQSPGLPLGSASLSASGNVQAATVAIDAAGTVLSGSGISSGAASAGLLASTNPAGSGSLAVNATVTVRTAATLAGSGTMATSAALQSLVASVLPGTSQLTAPASLRIPVSPSFVGAGSFFASASSAVSANIALISLGNLVSSTNLAVAGGGFLQGNATAIVTFIPTFGEASLLAESGLFAQPAPWTAQASLTGESALAASSAQPASAILTGSSSLTANQTPAQFAEAILYGLGGAGNIPADVVPGPDLIEPIAGTGQIIANANGVKIYYPVIVRIKDAA